MKYTDPKAVFTLSEQIKQNNIDIYNCLKVLEEDTKKLKADWQDAGYDEIKVYFRDISVRIKETIEATDIIRKQLYEYANLLIKKT